MRAFGLIGYPLSHSFSKKYFEEKFAREALTGCAYDLYPLKSISELPALLASNPQLCGLNVTIPYKESVLPLLHDVDETAARIGAVNCIKIDQGRLKGYNTDVTGFSLSLTAWLSGHKPEKVFVLGTGGSSKAVKDALQTMNLNFFSVSRSAQPAAITYVEIAPQLSKTNLFINTTPLGMWPDASSYPHIPYHLLGTNDFLFDLVYNPAETTFLSKGKEQGCQIKNGLEMLSIQAEESWKIWNA